MIKCYFVSDLHGHEDRYLKLIDEIKKALPKLVFIGGDILLSGLAYSKSMYNSNHNFIHKFLIPSFEFLKYKLGEEYPRIFIIMGNDDLKIEEPSIIEGEAKGVWEYIHKKKKIYDEYSIYGYANVPPTPFRLKDWERYDVSRYADPGCISPEDGIFSVAIDEYEIKYTTIKDELNDMVGTDSLHKSIILFHSPPHNTNLDYANLDGKKIEHIQPDEHVGSIAIRKFIERKHPYITLHGHIHESPRITKSWKDKIGDTYCFSAAHDKKELALVRFDLDNPEEAERELL